MAVRIARALALSVAVLPILVLAHTLTSGAAPAIAIVGWALLLTFAVIALIGPTRSLFALAVAQLGVHSLFGVLTGDGHPAGCLPAVGRGAELGLRLALVQVDGVCPPGSVALTESGWTSLSVVAVALTVLALHVAVSVFGSRTAATTEDAVRSAHRVAGWRGHAATTALISWFRALGSALVLPFTDPNGSAVRNAATSSGRPSWRDDRIALRELTPQWVSAAVTLRGPPAACSAPR